jgi:hypothetical protein
VPLKTNANQMQPVMSMSSNTTRLRIHHTNYDTKKIHNYLTTWKIPLPMYPNCIKPMSALETKPNPPRKGNQSHELPSVTNSQTLSLTYCTRPRSNTDLCLIQGLINAKYPSIKHTPKAHIYLRTK